jgi:hypothetical protein
MSKAADLANLIGNINMGGGGANRNVIINGAMNVAQRGTSSTGLGASSGYFTLDRFKMVCNNTAGRFTMSQDSSAPDGFANSLKLACTTADTSIASNEEFGILYRMEGQDLQHFKKGTSSAYPTTLSFYVKGNASATYVAELMDSDNSSRHIGATFNVTTDWTRVEITFPGDTTGTLDDDNAASLDLQFFLHAGSNNTSGTLQTSWGTLAQANRAVGISSFFDSTARTFFITGVQLEVGQNATEFELELPDQSFKKCCRYCEVLKGSSNALYGIAYNEDQNYATGIPKMFFPKRAAPTVSVNAVANFSNLSTGSTAALQTIDFQTNGNSVMDANHNHSIRYRATSSNTTLVDGGASTLAVYNNTAELTIDAEL